MNDKLRQKADKLSEYAGTFFYKPEESFEKRFNIEILKSEKRRITIIAILLLVVILIGSIVQLLYIRDIEYFYPKVKAYRYRGQLFLILGLCYEIFALFIIRRLIRLEVQPPEFPRYLNAFIEVSLPSLFLFLFSLHANPADALQAPITFGYFFFIMLSTLRLNFKLCMFTGAVAALEYAGIATYFRDGLTESSEEYLSMTIQSFYFKSIILFIGGIVAGIVSMQIKKSFINSIQAVEEQKKLIDMFGQHVSPVVAEKLIHQKVELQTELRSVCIMFLDIRNFTSFSESRSPVEVVNYLNVLFSFMIDSINENNGIINKFLGDGFMAVFGAPISDGRDSLNAVNASMSILKKIKLMNEAGEIPLTRIGIGLHSGEAVTGNVGSEIRKEYTIIGDVVNLASRIEQMNKELKTSFLMSEAVFDVVQDEYPKAQKKGPVHIKGKQGKIYLYSIGG